MNMKTIVPILATIVGTCGGLRASDLRIEDLRCEYLTNPAGIDVAKPRLSWKLQAEHRGQRQSGYRILVASAQEGLHSDHGDLWDSGQVEGDQTLNIEYAGRTLGSGQMCFWKVRCWDRDGQPSDWSPPARWSMGLLRPEDWHGRWIGRDEPVAEADNPLAGASWIWHDEPARGKDFPPGQRRFRRSFVLPADRNVAQATCYFAADNRHELWVNGRKATGGSSFKNAQGCDVTSFLRPGRNLVAIQVENLGEAANPAGLLGVIAVRFEEGPPVRLVTEPAWLSSPSAKDGWQKLEFDDTTWKPAVVLAPLGGAPWGEVTAGNDDRPLPARMLRRDFTAEKPVRRATAYVSGLGYYELYLNGHRIGDHVLDSVLMDYDFRVPYVTYDVTESIRRGENALGVILGNGRYFAPRVRVPVPTKDYGHPKLLLELVLEFGDGTTRTMVSDDSWRLTTEGPIRENNDYDGEVYDARREMPGWSEPGFDDSAWQTAEVVPAPAGRLVAPMMPPMRVIETLTPVKLTEPRPGVWVFDLGQNMVGWCRLHVDGPSGTTVRLRHAETLDDEGMLYTENLRSARCRDVYVLRGDGPEAYEPRFTYHGFRFVELTGYPGRPDLSTIQGRVVHTDLPSAGRFSSSNTLLNQLHENIRWGLRGNYLSIPTDCPQRDERQGWQGDRAAESKGETYFFENVTLYSKWLLDIQLSQNEEGNLSDVCPPYWPFYSGNVTWPSAYAIVPGTLYDQFGDRRNLEVHYASIQRWMDYLGQFVQDGTIARDTYGDWCVPPETPELIHSQDPSRKTGKAVLATTYYYHNLHLLSRYAMVLGRPQEEARILLDRAAAMNQAFHDRFFDSQSALYDNGTQTSRLQRMISNACLIGWSRTSSRRPTTTSVPA